MKTMDAVRRTGISIDAGASIRAAATMMEDLGVGALAVMDGSLLVGIVTDRDLVRRGIAQGVPGDARIDSMMSAPVITIEADADLHDAYALLRTNVIRRLVVVRDGDVVGMLTLDDLLVDLSGDLAALAQPVTGQVIFGQRDAAVPAAPS